MSVPHLTRVMPELLVPTGQDHIFVLVTLDSLGMADFFAMVINLLI